MKRLIKITPILFVLTIFGSCTKFIDTKPEDYLTSTNYYETRQQLEFALNAIYSTVAHYTLYGREMPRMGLDADEGFYDVSSELFGVSIYDVPSTDSKVASFWTTCYQGIYRANMLLANINKPKNITDEDRNIIKGETLFLRAYFYFLLVNRFGNVPYITSLTQEAKISQTPAKEVYRQIINDMEIAEGLVKTAKSVGSGSRINKSAVRGILARVNLYMAGQPVNEVSRYAEARKWAKMIIDDTDAAHQLNPDFKQVFINYSSDKYDIKESIWEIEFWGNNQDVYKEGGQIGAYNGVRYTGGDPNYGYSLGMVNASGTLWNRYANPTSLTSSDLRRDWTIAPFTVAGNPAVETARPITQIYERDCGKFRRSYEVVMPKDNQYTPINFPVLRYADVLLMFAEADNYVNSGPTADAYTAINQVRRRGYGLPVDAAAPAVDIADLDQNDFLSELQDERSRELAFECLRKSDLIRWGKFTEKMDAALNHAVNSSLSSSLDHALRYFENVSPRDVLWPIPSYELGVNSSLIQNTGW